MRFFENGPSIPDELLVARDEGRVVFFCGAGVSRARAGLSDFFDLADNVIQRLGISKDSPALSILDEAKKLSTRTGVDGLISADRIFGLLEHDFYPRDIEIEVAKVSAGLIEGTVEILDIRFGHLWTNVNGEMFEEAGFNLNDELEVVVTHLGEKRYRGIIPYVRSFGSVGMGEPLLYVNSLLNVAVGLHQRNFSETYNIGIGPEWKIIFRKFR